MLAGLSASVVPGDVPLADHVACGSRPGLRTSAMVTARSVRGRRGSRGGSLVVHHVPDAGLVRVEAGEQAARVGQQRAVL